MALAEALHHSAPRGHKSARAGVRPGVLEDPGPRRETEHEQHAALRGLKPGEAVDRTALSYLLQQSLAATKEEEKEERKLVELEVKRKEAELQSLAAATRVMVQQRAVGSSSWTSTLARSVQLRGELKGKRSFRRLPQVMDVPVIINDEFQQYPQCIRSCFLCCSWSRFLTCPFWYYDRCFFRWCRKPVESPQVQFLVKVICPFLFCLIPLVRHRR